MSNCKFHKGRPRTNLDWFLLSVSYAYFPYTPIEKAGGRIRSRDLDVTIELIKGYKSEVVYKDYSLDEIGDMPEHVKYKLFNDLPKILSFLYSKIGSEDFDTEKYYTRFMKEYNHFMKTWEEKFFD